MKNLSRYILIPFALFLGRELWSQVIWLEPEMNGDGLKNRISNELYDTGHQTETINFHAVPSFNNQSELIIDVPSLSQCQIFTVFKSRLGAKESLIWKLEQNEEDQLLFTDHRMFDYTKVKYMNFINHSPDRAQVYCYQQYRSDFQANHLRIGALPKNQEIPVTTFDGNLAELIVFQRVLAPITRKSIESYLALKYSVPLQLGEDYLSMDGSKIWDYSKNEDFPNGVAGLGRNDELQLYQRQSRSMLEGGSLALGLGNVEKYNHENPGVIQDNQYLLWSDDGNALDFVKTASFPYRLQRSWKLNASTFDDNQIFFLLEHDAMVKGLDAGEKIWLQLSREQGAEPKLDNSSFYEMKLDNGGLYVDGVKIKPEIYYFSFIKAPDFWAALELDNIACSSEESGVVKIKPIGGKAPYQIRLMNGSTRILNDAYSEEVIVIDDLNNERFDVEISDSDGNVYSTSFDINSDEINLSHVNLPTNVTTEEIQSYFESFHEELDIDYQWVLSNGEYSSGLNIDFGESGEYVLEMEKEGCKAWKIFEVTAPENNIEDMFINPNPSSTGYYNLSAELKRTAPYSIEISTLDGKVIFFQEFSEQKYIDYHGQLSNPGVYSIRLRSNGSQLSKKLIIVN